MNLAVTAAALCSHWSNMEVAGLLPEIILADDPRPAKEQFAERYAHGGGWNPMSNWLYKPAQPGFPGGASLVYNSSDEEDDAEEYPEVSRTTVNNETLILFECEFLAIVQPDGSFEVDRVD